MAGKPRFTRIPKTTELIESGVPAEAIGTYTALADYGNNKTGLCWPKMETLAATLNRSVRTIQRHLHLLRELGLIEFVTRRRNKGRFSSYLYKICFLATTGHGRPVAGGRSNRKRTKQLRTPPISPPKEALNWFFGKERNLEAEEEYRKQQEEKQKRESDRRREGYEWLFGE